MSRLRVEILESIKPAIWNGWVSRANWGTIFQTTFWADRLCELWDCQPYFFVVKNGDVSLPTLVLLGFDIRSDRIVGEHISLSARVMDIARKLLGTRRRFMWFGQPCNFSRGHG